MKNLFYLLFLFLLVSCNLTDPRGKYTSFQSPIDVSSYIHPIDLGDVLIGSSSLPVATDDYLIIGDYRSVDSIVHIFDINSFSYVKSLANYGESPDEITVFGTMSWNPESRDLYVTDGGKYEFFIYNIDSAIAFKSYKPRHRQINPKKFASESFFVNDSIACGVFVLSEFMSNNSYLPLVGFWNLHTDSIDIMNYQHSDVDSKRFSLAVSAVDKIYAECNISYDLISIFNFDGNLRWNIYGPNWGSSHTLNYMNACFTKDYLIASYDGTVYEEHNPITKCHIFTKDGDYLQSFDFGCQIMRFCYDAKNNRLILSLNHTFQYGYLDLDEVKF